MSRLQRTLIDEVRTYAKAQGFDLVIADGVIYSTPTLDITPQILSALQAHSSKGSAGASIPAPAPTTTPATSPKPTSK
jgi:outer membrane protein